MEDLIGLYFCPTANTMDHPSPPMEAVSPMAGEKSRPTAAGTMMRKVGTAGGRTLAETGEGAVEPTLRTTGT